MHALCEYHRPKRIKKNTVQKGRKTENISMDAAWENTIFFGKVKLI